MKNILIPTDLTDCTQNALKYAISLSVKSKTKLFFYHASVTRETGIKEQASKSIKSIFRELKLNYKNSKTEIIIENAHFSNALIKSAIEKYNIDFVLMGTSHDGLRITFFGTHVSELINELNCPVLSIPHGYSKIKIDRIGYATELYDLSERVRKIVPFAKQFDASIEAFHIYPVFPQIIDVEKYDSKKTLSGLRNENSYKKIKIHFIKTSYDNELIIGIREFIKSYKPDLLVMYHKQRSFLDKLFMDSGATPTVVKLSPIPILVLNEMTTGKLI
jgi:nucleotide-binding universal stress UspA family protein